MISLSGSLRPTASASVDRSADRGRVLSPRHLDRPGDRLVSAVLCLGLDACAAASRSAAARTWATRPFELGAFRLTERSGRAMTDADLADRVWVASFIFTHCPLSCPRITSVMKGLQARLAGTDVQLVSISVDPERDTPEVLADYARKFGADPDRWWFLTGPKADVERLIVERFKLGLATGDRRASCRPGPRRSRTATGWRWSIAATGSSATSTRTTREASTRWSPRPGPRDRRVRGVGPPAAGRQRDPQRHLRRAAARWAGG